jgi:hypothetical protein
MRLGNALVYLRHEFVFQVSENLTTFAKLVLELSAASAQFKVAKLSQFLRHAFLHRLLRQELFKNIKIFQYR